MSNAGVSLTAALLLLTGAGCSRTPPPPEVTLAQASDQVIFASVETLGPHRTVASIVRTDLRDGAEVNSHESLLDLAWQDWDNFRVRRLVDGEPVSESVVVKATAWSSQAGGGWSRREDAEPYRVQLQSTWNAWDDAFDTFRDRITLTEEGQEIIEGRRARRYAVSLTPLSPTAKAPRNSRRFEPVSLSGTVWIDEATAVRLVAQVEGELHRGDLTRRITLRLARSDFGADLGLQPPEAARDATLPSPSVPTRSRVKRQTP